MKPTAISTLARSERIARRIEVVFGKDATDVRLSTKVTLFDAAGNVLLLHDAGMDRWDLPGGHVHDGEAPSVAAEREVIEETGLSVVARNPATRLAQFPNGSKPILTFSAHVGGVKPAVTLSAEHDRYAWVKPSQANEYNLSAFSGFVPDAGIGHAEVQRRLEEDFAAAVGGLVAVAGGVATGQRREEYPKAAVGRLAAAAQSAYGWAAPTMTMLATNGADSGTASAGEVSEYAAGRLEFYKNFSGVVLERLDAVVKEVEDAGKGNPLSFVHEEERKIIAGIGKRLAQTEAQAVYGSSQLRALKRAGYTHKAWMTVGDDKVRPSHTECEAQGEVALGGKFSNGLLYPGDPSGGPEETCNCRCWLVGGATRQSVSGIRATAFDEGKHPRVSIGSHGGGQFTSKHGGISLKRSGTGKDSKWVTISDHDVPSHISKLVIPPAWSDVRVAPSASHDLQAIGRDAKGREVRIYSEAFVKKMAALKFSRNKELIQKRDSIIRQNDANLSNKNPEIAENAACMKLIQHTFIRPGSEHDTGAEKQAYGATTLEGRHVHINEHGKVHLRFTGKKGVDLDIPVEDHDTAEMLISRKRKAGSSGRLFDTNDVKLRQYSHTLDGGSFKPKDFRTLGGTMTAMKEISSDPLPAKTMAEYKKRVMSIAKIVAAKLGNTPIIALQSYINPFVFESIMPK
jgi:DNA topoisomerase-1